jgi:oxygen-independent coproporphyrinogen-3 oxidase
VFVRIARMTPELLEKYGGRVPRYTSYPTANHFGPGVGADAYASWLAALPPGEVLSLYLHIPFCEKLCWYCGCHTTIVSSPEPVESYLALLAREIDLVANTIGGPRAVSNIHWGGGTPTILEPIQFAAISNELRQRFRFGRKTEISVEIDPRGFTREMAAALAAEGVTRASLGVQDFDPAVQQAVNRVQSYETTARAVEGLRAEGIVEINLDLIYGLPHQSVDSVLATVDKAMSLAPTQVALFGYAHVPWMKRHQKLIDESTLPGTGARWALYWAAATRLAEHGMVAVGLDHFAAPDSALARHAAARELHRNFQGYTTDAAATLIGFGASAIGTLPQGYVQNAAKISDYREAISAGRLATARGCVVDEADRLRREVISSLMCNLFADVGAICRARGLKASALDPELDRLAPLVADGIVTRQGRKVTVNDSARPLVRSVCAVFDSYLNTGPGAAEAPRHARAV